ncbi:CopG family transcriptional regulator [Candidatus Geothermarchaeota archaeon]|nr:MAG: CopG family transcriptional regulator [Candidatus Geothermarchaeota archaeon]
MGKVVPVRIDESVLKFIDDLVKLGIYRSRSEAIRELIKAGMKDLKDYKEIADGVERLFKIERKLGKIPIELPGMLRELIAERERF